MLAKRDEANGASSSQLVEAPFFVYSAPHQVQTPLPLSLTSFLSSHIILWPPR